MKIIIFVKQIKLIFVGKCSSLQQRAISGRLLKNAYKNSVNSPQIARLDKTRVDAYPMTSNL